MRPTKIQTISVVTTLYNSSAYVEEFCDRIRKTIAKCHCDYEIILVNDGSSDDSLNKALKVHKKDARVKVINLSRNFGQHNALLAGLEMARGDYIVTIDIDLEEKPELVEEFLLKMKETGADVVYGVRKNDIGLLVHRLSRKLFWFLYKLISGSSMESNPSIIRIMNKKFRDALVSYREQYWYVVMITALCGFSQERLFIKRTYKGDTNYNFFKRIKLAVKHVISFTDAPLILISYVGFFITSVAFVVALVIAFRALFLHISTSGWTSIMISIWLLGGVIISFLGIIGLYIANIFMNVKQRPRYIVKDVYGKSALRQ